jgi:hypothetical protein
MTDTPPEFTEDARQCAGDSGRREAGGKELAKQKAEGQGSGSSRCQLTARRFTRPLESCSLLP